MLFRSKGWAGIGDWLGTGNIANRYKKFRVFKKARAYARNLGIKNFTEWRTFTKSGKLPTDIPTNPRATYKNEGWTGYGDWLGTGAIATHLRKYRTFSEARTFVQQLNFKNFKEWQTYTFRSSGRGCAKGTLTCVAKRNRRRYNKILNN